MSEGVQTQSDCVVWIDTVNRIVTFKKTTGFEPKFFSSQDERMAYVFSQISSGYRIQ